MPRLVFGVGIAALALSAAGAATASGACPTGMKPTATAELYFERDAGVSDADWRDFIETEVRPRFHAGFSVTDVYGLSRAGVARQSTKALVILLDGDADGVARVNLVRAAYQARFHQTSVLNVAAGACVAD